MNDLEPLNDEEDLLIRPVNKRLWSQIRVEELEDRSELTPPVPNMPMVDCGGCGGSCSPCHEPFCGSSCQ